MHLEHDSQVGNSVQTNAINEQSQKCYQQLLSGWITGDDSTGAGNKLPEGWQTLLDGVGEERRRTVLLSLATQHQEYTTTIQPDGDLQCHKPIPELTIPTISESLRPVFLRAMIRAKKHSVKSVERLLVLLNERGVSAHPEDWLPDLDNSAFPEVYWPWFHWKRELSQHQVGTSESEHLNAENWSDYFPAQRIHLLKKMRSDNPADARQLIESCGLSEAADKRLAIVATLKVNLAAADLPLLQTLSKDRSKKIALLARQFISQLGAEIENPNLPDMEQDFQQLSQWFEVKMQGLLKRRSTILPKKLKSKKQQSIRTEMLQVIPLQEFAKSFDMTVDALVNAWQFSANREMDNIQFLSNACNTLPTENLLQLLSGIQTQMAKDPDALKLIPILLPRLSEQQKVELMSSLMQNQHLKMSFSASLQFIEKPLQSITFEQLCSLWAWKQLLKELEDLKPDGGFIDSGLFFNEVFALSMLLPAAVAAKVTDKLINNGVHAADPLLEPLLLNRQLT